MPTNYSPIPVLPWQKCGLRSKKRLLDKFDQNSKLYHRAKQTTRKNQALFLSIVGQETREKFSLTTCGFQNKMLVNYSGDIIPGNKMSLCVSVVWEMFFMLFFWNTSSVIFSPFHCRLHLSRSILCMLCCLVLSVLPLPSCYLLQHHQMQ